MGGWLLALSASVVRRLRPEWTVTSGNPTSPSVTSGNPTSPSVTSGNEPEVGLWRDNPRDDLCSVGQARVTTRSTRPRAMMVAAVVRRSPRGSFRTSQARRAAMTTDDSRSVAT